MFGTVPKVVWSKAYPADDDNQILMATNCLLVRGFVNGKQENILIDNGNGDKEDEVFMARFKFEGRGVLDRELARFNLTPTDITCCILTHLHFDHAGGSTRFDIQGRLVPSFPNARYIVQHSIGPGTRIRVTRSGEVIPYIVEVVKGSKEPQMPNVEYEWNETRV
ncbi:MAG: MBL fold metallo-hydrolase, partial [Holophagaceae bacterium]